MVVLPRVTSGVGVGVGGSIFGFLPTLRLNARRNEGGDGVVGDERVSEFARNFSKDLGLRSAKVFLKDEMSVGAVRDDGLCDGGVFVCRHGVSRGFPCVSSNLRGISCEVLGEILGEMSVWRDILFREFGDVDDLGDMDRGETERLDEVEGDAIRLGEEAGDAVRGKSWGIVPMSLLTLRGIISTIGLICTSLLALRS